MSKNIILLLSVLLVCTFSASSLFKQFLLPRTSPGLCLDGSPAAHYIAEGEGVNKTKFLLYFEGGLACAGEDIAQSLENCYQKSQTDEGSSKYLDTEFDGSKAGIVSGDPLINPTFYDWTRVLFEYCDGSMYQGYKNLPISYKDTNLYFRGHNITEQRLLDLNLSHNLFSAAQIVLAGSEDGAVAAMQWSNQVAKMTNAPVKVVADSGILIDMASPVTKRYYYRENYINLLKLANEIDPPVPACVDSFPDEKWKCMFVEYLYPFVNEPLFIVDTLYDEESFSYTLGVDCVDSAGSLAKCSIGERLVIESYKTQVYNLIGKIFASRTTNGAWAPACVNFDVIGTKTWYADNYRVPEGSLYTCNAAVGRWLAKYNEVHKHVDTVTWPNNHACSGVKLINDAFTQ